MAKKIFGYEIGTRTILLIFVIVVVLVAIGFITSCDGKGEKSKPVPNNATLFCNNPDIEAQMAQLGTWKRYAVTPKGANVYSAVDFPDEVLTTVDEAIAISAQLQGYQTPTWKNGLEPTSYEIMFLPSKGLTPQGKVPFITVSGIMTAGTVSVCNQTARPERNAIILPEHSATNWADKQYLINSIVYEDEHRREYLNDRAVFAQFTGANDSHPHRPYPPELQTRGLLSAESQKFVCAFPSN